MTLPKDPIKAAEARERYRISALNRPSAWSKNDVITLELLLSQNKIHEEIAKILNRTQRAVSGKAYELGLKSNVNTPGIQNIHFKGNNAGYKALHMWIRENKLKPDACEKCHTFTVVLEARNISGQYHRDLDDWEYICIPCHRRIDKKGTGLNPLLVYRPDRNLAFKHQIEAVILKKGDK